ncbi:MAG: hypothetical protein ABL869_04080 [Candidatus Nitrotoga sp.]
MAGYQYLRYAKKMERAKIKRGLVEGEFAVGVMSDCVAVDYDELMVPLPSPLKTWYQYFVTHICIPFRISFRAAYCRS